MIENKVKEILTLDYIYIPYKNESDVHLRENKNVFKEDLIIKGDFIEYSPVSGIFKGVGEINSVSGVRKVIIIENDFKDNIEKKNISVDEIYDLKSDIIKKVWHPTTSEIYLKIGSSDIDDIKDEYLLSDHMSTILKTLDILDLTYPDIKIKILLDKSNIRIYESLFSYLGTYPNITVEFGSKCEGKIMSIYEVIDIYNELKKCNKRDYIYITLINGTTFECIKTKKNGNLKDLLAELDIYTDSVIINKNIKLSGNNFLLDDEVYKIDIK